jgi:trimethylamine:corrinoid methyltransferase-like protein
LNKLYSIVNSVSIDDLNSIHDYSCRILSDVGMKFLSDEMLSSLEENGARINRKESVAFIPQKLVEEKLQEFSDEIKSGMAHMMLNGGVSYDVGDRIFCKFGSIAPKFFDWDSQSEREATQEDLVKIRPGSR